MQLTFVNDLGNSFVVEIDPNMELENVMALLEAESGIPITEQVISFNDRELVNQKSTMRELGVDGPSQVLHLRRRLASVAGRPLDQDAEMLRLQMLGDPALLRQVQEVQPELAQAAQSDPARFAELLRLTKERQMEAELEKQREIAHLNADPFDVEAQRKIEEAIRLQAVMENMEHAWEYTPEIFANVHMLYVPVEINGVPVKAFVDSGAQKTIMNPACAEKCGIMRLIDSRFQGVAKGVGTAKILGRVHSAQLKLSDMFLPCAITIMEADVDLLFGLDMLKAHQACIDLEKNVLRIRGREVPFLSEHELPAHVKQWEEEGPQTVGQSSKASSSAQPVASQSFPGQGSALGSQPSQLPNTIPYPSPAAQTRASHPESSIRTIMDLGVTREVAISTLDAAGGNVDVAASLLF